MRKIKFNIIEIGNDNIILASCQTLELAKKYFKEMKKTDKKLKEYYNWRKLPKYKIVESKGE